MALRDNNDGTFSVYSTYSFEKEEKMKHARISASRVERVALCPASLRLEDGFPQTTNDAAERGTYIHDVSERILLGEAITEAVFDGEDVFPIVQEYVAFIQDMSINGNLTVEEDLTPYLTSIHPDLGGTSDAVIELNDTLIVVDLKTGRVPVSAKNNMQLKTYALGSLIKHGIDRFKTVEMLIFQPEIGVSHEEISVEELKKFVWELKEVAEKANDPFAKAIAGNKQCKYCKAKQVCPALKDKANEAAKDDFALPKNNTLAENLELAELVGLWAESIKDHAKQTLIDGGNIEGWELKPGRKSIKWNNEVAAEAHFAGNHLYLQIKSVAALKKLKLSIPEELLKTEVSAPSLARKKNDFGG